ncbi:hypothetical protein G6F68_020298 [Rhizopus microsporus]|uniref:Uncharacterized protein n=1 Tax=Rhizopus delemar TaxID=936053 RepID=A0A9P6XTH1_9FUNG|nr:hypothetical protein G6F68_020298 [Rhizopus microsporus]KAG1532164.1 hypothetical protein G6F50_016327 [Rhizopus delemar]
MDLAATQRQLPEQGAQQRGLAHAVAAQQGHDLPRADLQVHAEQDLAGAVAALGRFDGEHHAVSSSPR